MADQVERSEMLALGEMPQADAIAILASFDEKSAAEFEHGDPPYKHSSHIFGFIASDSGLGPHAIQGVGDLAPDSTLKGARINVTLNRLSVAKYPGSGTHDVLFEFTADNQVIGGAETVNFSSRYRISDGGVAGVVGAPIFIGLVVGNNIMRFKCRTVNVASDNDIRFLSFLDLGVLREGLKLASTAQPAIAPLSAMVTGITKSILATRQNVTVQNIEMGLDFGGSPAGARLALGDYVAVQVPPEALAAWDWSKWIFKQNTGQILSNDPALSPIPYNYMIFGISRYQT